MALGPTLLQDDVITSVEILLADKVTFSGAGGSGLEPVFQRTRFRVIGRCFVRVEHVCPCRDSADGPGTWPGTACPLRS